MVRRALSLSFHLCLLLRRTLRVVNYIRIELRPPILCMIRIQNIGRSLTTGSQCHLMIPLCHAQSSSFIIDIFTCFDWVSIIVAIFAIILLLTLLKLTIASIRVIWIWNWFLPSKNNSHLATLIAWQWVACKLLLILLDPLRGELVEPLLYASLDHFIMFEGQLWSIHLVHSVLLYESLICAPVEALLLD